MFYFLFSSALLLFIFRENALVYCFIRSRHVISFLAFVLCICFGSYSNGSSSPPFLVESKLVLLFLKHPMEKCCKATKVLVKHFIGGHNLGIKGGSLPIHKAISTKKNGNRCHFRITDSKWKIGNLSKGGFFASQSTFFPHANHIQMRRLSKFCLDAM